MCPRFAKSGRGLPRRKVPASALLNPKLTKRVGANQVYSSRAALVPEHYYTFVSCPRNTVLEKKEKQIKNHHTLYGIHNAEQTPDHLGHSGCMSFQSNVCQSKLQGHVFDYESKELLLRHHTYIGILKKDVRIKLS
jgi:hypothetical protein